ncbi:MAG: MinD/ParA family protein [Bacillota bacterium]
MIDQETKLRELARNYGNGGDSSPSIPRTIAITSGKGGVGKTSVVVNLALQLAKMEKKVAIIDADFGLSNAEILMGCIPPYSMYDVFNQKKTIAEIVVDVYGISLIPGGSGFQEMANLDREQLDKLLTQLKDFVVGYDFLFIDTGAGISKNVLGFVVAAQEVIVVTTSEPTSLTDAYSMIKILSNFHIHSKVNVIINRALNYAEVEQTRKKLDTAVEKFLQIRINHLGYIIEDKCVAKAVKNQRPFIITNPNFNASRDIYKISCSLLQLETSKVNTIDRLIGKLVNLFR